MSSRRTLLTLLVAGALLVMVGVIVRQATQSTRSTPAADPPVLAGQQLWGACAGGFYARRGDTIVLTSSGHCTSEGTVAYADDGTVRGTFGPEAIQPTCPHPGKRCFASDMNYLVVAEDQIPWGRLNRLDFGEGGHRSIEPGSAALACGDIAVGDGVEINGRNINRTGTATEKGEYLHDADGDYFACMVAADIEVGTGDSGGAVLVRGLPAGVASRSFNGFLGFTPLAEGLDFFGMDLCTTPNCDLEPPAR